MILQKILVYGCIGILIECLFTGLHSLFVVQDRRARCTTFLWMLPIYGLGAVLLGEIRTAIHNTWIFVPVGTLFIFTAEFLSGLFFWKGFRLRLWDYSKAKTSIMGLIRTDYAPFWMLVTVFFDRIADLISKTLRMLGEMA
jgi:uncharacterized membrane protein